MLMYMSVTRCKQLIAQVLEPVLRSAKHESQYAKNVARQLDDVKRGIAEARAEVDTVRRGQKGFEEFQKTFFKFQADFVGYQSQVENNANAMRSLIDTCKNEVARTNREHEADQLRIERVQKQVSRTDTEITKLQNRVQEMLAMHDEEYLTRTLAINERITGLDMQV